MMNTQEFRQMTKDERRELIDEHGVDAVIEMLRPSPRVEGQPWRGVNTEFLALSVDERLEMYKSEGVETIHQLLRMGSQDADWR